MRVDDLTAIMARLDKFEERFDAAMVRVYAEMKMDRLAMDNRRETDREVFLAQLHNVFSNGCSHMPEHRDIAGQVKVNRAELDGLKAGQQRMLGVLWFIGFASPLSVILAPVVYNVWRITHP